MAQIKISELPTTDTGNGFVPIVQDGETKKFDLSNAPAYWNTTGSRTFTNRQCYGFITNSSKSLILNVPYSLANSDGSYVVNSLSLSIRFTDGGYGYARSGSSGGTYTELQDGSGNPMSIWNNDRTVRTNEVASIGCLMARGSYIYIRVNFTYGLCVNSTGTVLKNNTPVAGQLTFTLTRL